MLNMLCVCFVANGLLFLSECGGCRIGIMIVGFSDYCEPNATKLFVFLVVFGMTAMSFHFSRVSYTYVL